jgi:hypothetical protein
MCYGLLQYQTRVFAMRGLGIMLAKCVRGLWYRLIRVKGLTPLSDFLIFENRLAFDQPGNTKGQSGNRL